MKRLVEFPLEEGGTILVEVDAPKEPGIVPAARGATVEKAQQTFEQALEKIRPAAQSIIAKLRDLNDPPDEVEVEFGVKMNAEAGAIFASVSGEANYKVTLTWKQEKKG